LHGSAVLAQLGTAGKHVPEVLRNMTIKNELFTDLIIYEYDDFPEYDSSQERDTIVWDNKRQDSIFKRIGMKTIEKGLRIKSVESRDYEDSLLIAKERHIGVYKQRYLRQWVGGYYIQFMEEYPYSIMVGLDLDSLRGIGAQIGIAGEKLNYNRDTTRQVLLPCDSFAQSYPYQIELNDSTEWEYSFVTIRDTHVTDGRQYRFIEGEKVCSISRYKDTTINGTTQYTTFAINPNNESQSALDRFSQKTETKRRIYIVKVHAAFGLLYASEICYIKNKQGAIVRLKYHHYNVRSVTSRKGLWKCKGKKTNKQRSTTFYEYDELNRLSKSTQTGDYVKGRTKYEVYEYGDGSYIDPKNIILENWWW
jgi:hypothetical protein